MCPPPQWAILVPELRQCLPVENAMRFMDMAPKNPQLSLWSMLARPVTASRKGRKQIVHQPTGYFKLLSNELLAMILEHLDHLDHKKDLVAFGLASMHMWELVIHHIQAGYMKAAAPWANTQLIFQSSDSEELPPKWKEKSDLATSSTRDRGWMHPGQKFYWAHKRFPAPISPEDQARSYKEAMESCREESFIPESIWKMLEEDLMDCKPSPAGHEWVLRNLTTREVIDPCMMKAVDPDWRLGDLLMRKIRWSVGIDMDYYRGDWVGHRFDMVTREAYLKEAGGDWTLVSRDALEDEPEPDKRYKQWEEDLWMDF